MTNSFTGLVVGGPLDGQFLEHYSELYVIATLPDDLCFVDDVKIRYEDTVRYLHTNLFGRGFWIQTTNDLGFLIDELSDKYWRYIDATK